MRHHASPEFWRRYQALPAHVRRLADKNFSLLKADPEHPSLHFKRINDIWSVRVGVHYRALAFEHQGDLIWFWIGSHSDYDKIIG